MHEKAANTPEGFDTQMLCTLQVCCEVFAGLDKLAQQKREEAGSKALPALGKRSRLELDDADEETPIALTSQHDAGNKGQPRQYRSNRLDTPSHPGQPPMLWLRSTSRYLASVHLSQTYPASLLICAHKVPCVTLASMAMPCVSCHCIHMHVYSNACLDTQQISCLYKTWQVYLYKTWQVYYYLMPSACFRWRQLCCSKGHC
jgi:hypothetical protein